MGTVTHIAKECYSCNICVKECGFLQENGTPGEICDRFLQGHQPDKTLPYQCNLCGLCQAVCPKKLDSAEAFLQMRRAIHKSSGEILPAHSALCKYESIGSSPLFSLHQLPLSCDTIFFPGCALSATRSETTFKIYQFLKTVIPTIGIVLDCCTKPSHDLGREEHFNKMFSGLISRLKEKGVKKIITACPSCFVTFSSYGQEFGVTTLYEELAKNSPAFKTSLLETVSIHDTCVTRNRPKLHDAVRKLVIYTGAEISEVAHSKGRAICCGEGAGAAFVVPTITAEWKAIRKEENSCDRVITYCAGCSHTLGKDVVTTHLLDLLFNTKKAMLRREQKTRSPFTYLRRLLLKLKLKNNEEE